jgi:hypothetical protein
MRKYISKYYRNTICSDVWGHTMMPGYPQDPLRRIQEGMLQPPPLHQVICEVGDGIS